jgi:acetate kinase
MASTVLTMNGGSSSVKFALFAIEGPNRRLAWGQVERIDLADAALSAQIAADEGSESQPQAADHEQSQPQPAEHRPLGQIDFARAAVEILEYLDRRGLLGQLAAVGHRIVHGAANYSQPCLVTPQVIQDLKRLAPLDPAHLPGEIAVLESVGQRFPDLPQVACFDTAFHHDLQRVAQLLPIPRSYANRGVRRFGFHGLSYAYLLEELARVAGQDTARGRVILAHLGNGASMAAVRDGQSLDTTMAFTPTAGLVMGTRSGDLDPGLLVYLAREEKLGADEIDALVNRRSGMLGISETSPDMRDLQARKQHDPRAADAVDVFCYQARKWIGALAAALGGLETLVFSGGIGENSAATRSQICDGLDFLGVHLDGENNSAHAAVISGRDRPVTVRVMRTDEELMIARLSQRVLEQAPSSAKET